MWSSMALLGKLWLFLATLCLVGVFGEEDDKHKLLKEEWCGDESCYDVLGVLPSDDFRTIKKTYNNISLALHPDKNPNQTEEDKDKYVRVNKAYEILSSSEKRVRYDEYLKLKSSMDSPREHPLFVLLIVYGMIVVMVYHYQKQKHKRMREGILEIPTIQQWLQRHKKIDINQTKSKKVKRSRSKRGLKDKEESESDLLSTLKQTLGEKDDKTKLWMNDVSDEMINEALEKNNTIVPHWDKVAPSYQSAAWDVPMFCLSMVGNTVFFVRWHLLYTLLKFDCSESDAEEMCRRAHNKTFEEWEAMSDNDKSKFLQRPGPWKPEKNKKKKA